MGKCERKRKRRGGKELRKKKRRQQTPRLSALVLKLLVYAALCN